MQIRRKLGLLKTSRTFLASVAALIVLGLASGAATAQESAPTKPVISLCSVPFQTDLKSRFRMSGDGKACLDDVALNLQKSPDARLALVGNANKSEKSAALVAAHRAYVVRRYLVGEKGISPKRIASYSGHEDAATVSISLIPPHAVLDTRNIEPVQERQR